MAFTNPLSDKLSTAASSIGGLLSQMESALGNGLPTNDLFSNLLSQNVSTSLQAPQTTTAQSSVSLASDKQSLSSSSDSLLKTLGNLAANLRKALAQLHQQNKTTQTFSAQSAANNSTRKQDTSISTDAQNGVQTPTTTASTSEQADASVTDTVSSDGTTDPLSASSDKKALADILQELLLLTQMVIKNIQQTQVTQGGTSVTSSETTTAMLSSNTDSPNKALSPLEQLIAALEKTTEMLQEIASEKDGSTLPENSKAKDFSLLATGLQEALNGNVAVANQAIDAFDTTTQLAALSAKLKKTFAIIEDQNKAATAEPLLSSTASSSIQALPSQNLQIAGEATTKNSAASDASQTPSVVTAAQAIGNEKSPNNTSTASQTLVTGEAFAAAVSKENATGFGSQSDMSDGSKNGPSFNNSNSNITAGGAQVSGTYSFASTLSAARAMNGGTTGLPTVVDQVILQMNRSVKNGNDQMSLQLQPGDLGKITVKLDFGSDGKVQGTVTADNPQTLSLLQKDSRSLERALQDAGLRADPGSLQFNLGGQAGQHSGQMANNGGNANNTNGNGTTSASVLGDESGLIDLSTSTESYYITPSGVNIQV